VYWWNVNFFFWFFFNRCLVFIFFTVSFFIFILFWFLWSWRLDNWFFLWLWRLWILFRIIKLWFHGSSILSEDIVKTQFLFIILEYIMTIKRLWEIPMLELFISINRNALVKWVITLYHFRFFICTYLVTFTVIYCLLSSLCL